MEERTPAKETRADRWWSGRKVPGDTFWPASSVGALDVGIGTGQEFTPGFPNFQIGSRDIPDINNCVHTAITVLLSEYVYIKIHASDDDLVQ